MEKNKLERARGITLLPRLWFSNFLMFMIAGVQVDLVYGQGAQDTPGVVKYGDSGVKRLSPAAFSQLPRAIVQSLVRHDCLIPQAHHSAALQNVISGAFMGKVQKDWAVLCSLNGVSTIWIFPEGSAQTVSKIAEEEDAGYMQVIDERGVMGFSRAISAASQKYIMQHSNINDGRRLSIKHQGIDDAFVGKASRIHYYYRGRWVKLPGAD